MDLVNKKCEGCQLKRSSFGLLAEGKKRRWCAGCAKGHAGAVFVKKKKVRVKKKVVVKKKRPKVTKPSSQPLPRELPRVWAIVWGLGSIRARFRCRSSRPVMPKR